MANKTFTIKGGPSQFDLMVSLFEGKQVLFTGIPTGATPSGLKIRIHSKFYAVISRLETGGERTSFKFTARLQNGDIMTGAFNVKDRNGSFHVEPKKLFNIVEKF